MPLPFFQVALIGKYQSPGMRSVLECIGTFLTERNIKVYLEGATAANTGLTGWGAYSMDDLGRSCELAIVVGGDGTMLGCARAWHPWRSAAGSESRPTGLHDGYAAGPRVRRHRANLDRCL